MMSWIVESRKSWARDTQQNLGLFEQPSKEPYWRKKVRQGFARRIRPLTGTKLSATGLVVAILKSDEFVIWLLYDH
jgi:hypothetical protein